jgi:hypothetical protein
MPRIGERLVKKYYRIKTSHIDFISIIAKEKKMDEAKVLRSILDMCVGNKVDISNMMSGNKEEKSEKLKNNMSYVYRIIDNILETSFKKNQDITADLLAKYAIINLENFYIFKSFLSDKYKSDAIENKITEFRKKAIMDLKDNSIFKDILQDLKKEGYL